MSVAKNAGIGIIALAWIAASILGLIIHVWTIVISLSFSGMFAAVLTLIFPVLSEMFWFVVVGRNLGFGTMYCVSLMAYVILLCILYFGAALLGKEE